MGNFIGYTGTTQSKVERFIDRHSKEWPVILNKIRLGRKLDEQQYLDEANDIIVPLLVEDRIWPEGDIETARAIWKEIRSKTMPEDANSITNRV